MTIAGYDAFAGEAGVMDARYPYGDVRRYGALLAGADETQALINACAAVQAKGGGTVTIPGNLTILSTAYSSKVPASPFISFARLNNVAIVMQGRITIDRAFKPGTTLDLFTFTSCTGVRVDLSGIIGDASCGATQTTPTGAYVVRLLGACRDVDIKMNGTNLAGLVGVTAAAGAADNARTKGIKLDLVVNNCEYGFNAQFSGDDVHGTIVSDRVHRSYFIYGVRGHTVSVQSRNNHADDCLLRTYLGQGCEDIELTYVNTGSTRAAKAAPGVSIAPNVSSIDLRPGVMRNITINVHVEYDGNDGPGNAIYLYKTLDDARIDTADRGHVIDGLTIRAYVKGQNAGNSAYPMLIGGMWGTRDRMTRIRVDRFECFDVHAATYLMFPSLKDRALIQNVISSSYVFLSAGPAGKITATNCKAPALVASATDTSWIDYVDCEITTGDMVSFRNKTFRNTRVNGRMFNILAR